MWYEDFDFYEDPLSTDAQETHDSLVGVDSVLDEIYYRIESGSMIFLEGPQGSGKTSLLFRVIDRYKGKKRVIYFDCSQIERKLNIERLMKNRYGVAGNLLNIVPHNMILLLDNISSLSKRNDERIKYYFDQNYIQSVIFTGERLASSALPRSIKERIGTRVLKLSPLTEEEAVDVVRQRLKEVEFIPDAIVVKAFRQCDRNIEEMLQCLGRMCELASKADESAVSDKHLKAVMGDKNA